MATPDNTVRLAFAGRSFEGWTSFSVTRSMEAASSSFELTVSDRFPGRQLAQPIKSGEACELWVGADRLVSGYVDSVSRTLAARERRVDIRGRDRIADLIDCANPALPAEFYNMTLLELAAALAGPFAIPVRADVDVGPHFKKVSINPGSRGFEVLEAQCRFRQILPLSDGQGGLVLTRAGRERVQGSLAEGINILAGSADFSHVDRFSHYTVKGQSFDLGDGAQAPSEMARDEGVRRYRPLLIVAEEAVDGARCLERARWEALTRAARGEEASVTVQGWRDQGGALWRPNTLVPARSPVLGLEGEYLITEASLRLSPSEGTTTALRLVRRDAYQVQPMDESQASAFLADIPAEAED